MKKIHISFLFRFVFTFFLVFILVISFIRIFSNKLNNHYLGVAELQSEKVASIITLNTVSRLLQDKYSEVSFIIDNEDVFNVREINNLLKDSVNVIYDELKKVEDGTSNFFESKYGKGIIYEVPFYLFSDSVILASIGPKIPVKFSLVSDVCVNVNSQIEEFGLNNALVSINVKVDFVSRVYVPLQSKIVETSILVPLYSKIIEGNVPSFYPGLIEGVDIIYASEVKI